MCTLLAQQNYFTFVVFEQNVRNAQSIHMCTFTETCQENMLYHDFRDSISS